MSPLARFVVAVSCGFIAVGLPQLCAAQNYPIKPIRAVIPFPPGTPQDFILRLISERVQIGLKQPLIIENRPGATGTIGAEIVAKALAHADVRERMMAVDLVYTPGTPAEAAARLQRESAKWKQVVDRIKLQVD